MATLGAQQQAIGQNAQLFPLQQLANEASLLRGYTIPTSQNATYTGPIPGAYAASPLQQIAGLGTLAAGIGQTDFGKYLGSTLSNLGTSLADLFKSDTPQIDTSGVTPPTFTGTPQDIIDLPAEPS